MIGIGRLMKQENMLQQNQKKMGLWSIVFQTLNGFLKSKGLPAEQLLNLS